MKERRKILLALSKECRVQADLKEGLNVLESLYEQKDKLLLEGSSIFSKGICSHLCFYGDFNTYLGELFKEWEHFSGKVEYPISLSNCEWNPYLQYHRLPKYSGEYGVLRFKLIKHCIKKFKKDLKWLKKKELNKDVN